MEVEVKFFSGSADCIQVSILGEAIFFEYANLLQTSLY